MEALNIPSKFSQIPTFNLHSKFPQICSSLENNPLKTLAKMSEINEKWNERKWSE
jgi:hypothetical protein